MTEPFVICGNDPKALLNAPLRGEKAVVIDLYETVPEEERDAAELLTREALSFLDYSGMEVTLRHAPEQSGGQPKMETVTPVKPAIQTRGDAEAAPRRDVPDFIPGYGKVEHFTGAFTHMGERQRTTAKVRTQQSGQPKVVTLEEAIRRSGLKDGMTVSFHHHLRNGDRVTNLVMQTIADMGFRDIHLAASGHFCLSRAPGSPDGVWGDHPGVSEHLQPRTGGQGDLPGQAAQAGYPAQPRRTPPGHREWRDAHRCGVYRCAYL